MQFLLPAEYSLKHLELEDEILIGGVYIRGFIKDPTYPLKKPSVFLHAMLNNYFQKLNALGSKLLDTGFRIT